MVVRANATVFDWDGVVGDMPMVKSGSVVSIPFIAFALNFFVIFPAASSALTLHFKIQTQPLQHSLL